MWSRDGLELHQFLVSVSSRQKITMSWSRLFASRGQDFVLPKLVWIKGIEYCTNFLSLSEQGVYAWSRLHVTAPYKLILCVIIIIINRRENKVTTAVIITCRPRPIFTSQWHLVTYKRLVSGFNVSCPSLQVNRSLLGSFRPPIPEENLLRINSTEFVQARCPWYHQTIGGWVVSICNPVS